MLIRRAGDENLCCACCARFASSRDLTYINSMLTSHDSEQRTRMNSSAHFSRYIGVMAISTIACKGECSDMSIIQRE